jgi:hypothetical protein
MVVLWAVQRVMKVPPLVVLKAGHLVDQTVDQTADLLVVLKAGHLADQKVVLMAGHLADYLVVQTADQKVEYLAYQWADQSGIHTQSSPQAMLTMSALHLLDIQCMHSLQLNQPHPKLDLALYCIDLKDNLCTHSIESPRTHSHPGTFLLDNSYKPKRNSSSYISLLHKLRS